MSQTRSRPRSLGAERGSIPVALMVTLVAAALGIMVVGNVVAGQRTTRFDRSYNVTLHVADAGVQEVGFRLNNKLFPENGVALSGSGVAEGIPYSWTATRSGPDATDWQVRSSSQAADGVERRLRVVYRDRPLFLTPLATDRTVGFTGNNGADSYNSSTGAPTHCTWGSPGCTTGNGIIASNGIVELPSNAYVDMLRLYDWAANPGPPARCYDNTTGTQGIDYCVPPYMQTVDEPLNFAAYLDQVNEEMATCPAADLDREWRASAQPGASNPNSVVEFPFEPGKHCFGRLVMDRGITLRSTVTGTAPLLLYVRDYIELSGGNQINCDGCQNNVWQRPVAGRLQMFIPATTHGGSDAVKISNQTKFSGAIYAPLGKCGNLGTSNAGVHIYGALVCEEVRNNGGWFFHYDDALAKVRTTGMYDVASWTEE
jgi:hypothetical protein